MIVGRKNRRQNQWNRKWDSWKKEQKVGPMEERTKSQDNWRKAQKAAPIESKVGQLERRTYRRTTGMKDRR